MNDIFWIGVHPAVTPTMWEFAKRKIEADIGVDF